jgi:hypothetical protein
MKMRNALRYVLVAVLWPPVYLHDRLTGVNPPASFRRGWAWAQGEIEPTIRIADQPVRVIRPNCTEGGADRG